MTRVPDRLLADSPQHTRNELSAAWDQLLTAAEHQARRVGRSSRRRSRAARQRAALAALALRGELSPAPWRWFATGLAAGVVIGVAGTALARRRCTGTDQAGSAPAGTAESAPAGDAAAEPAR